MTVRLMGDIGLLILLVVQAAAAGSTAMQGQFGTE